MPSNKPSKIEQKVMASVGTIYTARILTGTMALEIYALVLSIWAIGRLAWVAKVFANFALVEKAGFASTANFVVSALEHAHLGVQIALVVAAAACIALVRDFAITLRQSQTPAYRW
jgi:hypothetical protein